MQRPMIDRLVLREQTGVVAAGKQPQHLHRHGHGSSGPAYACLGKADRATTSPSRHELRADGVLGEHALLAKADGGSAVALRQLELAKEAAEVAAAERLVERRSIAESA